MTISEQIEIVTTVFERINANDTGLESSLVDSAIEILAGMHGAYPELDVQYIRLLDSIPIYMENDDVYMDGWHWYAPEIASGQYPIHKLPAHVRAIARNLFYEM